MTFSEWLANIIQSTNKEDIGKIIAIINNIWHAWNCLIFLNRDIPAMHVVHFAMTSYQETQATFTSSKHSTTRVGNMPGRLQGPSAWPVLGLAWPVYKNARLRLWKKHVYLNMPGSGF
jgi:hypothetical protein